MTSSAVLLFLLGVRLIIYLTLTLDVWHDFTYKYFSKVVNLKTELITRRCHQKLQKLYLIFYFF